MNVIEKLVQSKEFKKLLPKLYGIGASVTVIGALFKIEHLPGSSIMLSAGLLTEAVIFFFSAFEGEDEPVRVYPEILDNHDYGAEELPSYAQQARGVINGDGGSVALAKFDKMLEEADITPNVLMALGNGMRKLGETTEQLNSMGNISEASKQYMNTIKAADESLGKLAKTYESTIGKVTCNTVFKYKGIANSLSIVEEETRSYQEQMESLTKNIDALNTIYKMQRKEENDHLKELTASVIESKKYRQQISELNDHLAALNKFYGNMRSAMKIR
jgi:gliding motility-associated protein GldL